MKLPEALDAALRGRYMSREIKRPVTHRQGLTARLNALEKLAGGTQRALAASLGVSRETIRRWRKGEQKPTPATLRKIEREHRDKLIMPRLKKRVNNSPLPNSVSVSAEVNWNGYKNRVEQRTVTLGGMRPVMVQVIRAWAAGDIKAAADVFERGAATVHNVPNSADNPGIQFEGDDVTVSFPWE